MKGVPALPRSAFDKNQLRQGWRYLARQAQGWKVELEESQALKRLAWQSFVGTMKVLADAGLLLRESAGNQVLYRANQASPLFAELKAIFRKSTAGASRRGQPKGDATPAAAIEYPRHAIARPAMHELDSPKAAYAVPARAKLRIPMGKLAALCRRHGIRKLSLFGSASRNELRADSDVDLIVEFGGSGTTLFDFPQLKEELSALFGGRPVDLVPPEVMRNPFRRKSIERDLQVLYESG